MIETTRANHNAPRAKRPVLRAAEITKSFGGTTALADVTLELFAGEIHAVVGENGAGKSTLTKVLSGVYSPDRGHVVVDGTRVNFHTPIAAQRAGISIIFQEPTVFPDLTVAENVYIGRQPRRVFGLGIDHPRMRQEAGKVLASLGVSIDPSQPVQGLSVAELQTVEMASALTRSSRVLIVDEPTASLTPTEVNDLFRILRDLASSGVAILFIGHRLEEVFGIADRITILRDGATVSSGPVAEYTEDRVIREMVGRSVEFAKRDRSAHASDDHEVILEAHGISRVGEFEDVGFRLRRGQVTALAGLVGSGRTEIALAVAGLTRIDSGRIEIDGTVVAISRPSDAQRCGIAIVPEDRQTQGVALDFTIGENIAIPSLRSLSRWGLLNEVAQRALASTWIEKLGIKAWGGDQKTSELSGGNQQKVALAKWLSTNPRILILDEPTRGVDIGAKDEIHRLIDDLLGRGLSVLMISSDLPEVLAVADEIVVIREGRVAGTLPRGAEAVDVMALAVGSQETKFVIDGGDK
jgi:rhamnose transport system ATP-binding protein